MYLKSSNPTLLETKQHFKILDGLRGVAAIAVVIFHFMEIAVPDYNNSFIAHAYLAVDFFFCLSGFVIAYAYDQKILNIGTVTFLKLRLIRLHPLVIIGSIIGLLVFVFDPYSNLLQLYSGKTFLMFLTSCLMIPYPLVHERYFNLFHLNPPTWSLFWEYIANVFYALLFIRLRTGIIWVLVLIAALAICYESQKSGYLGVGWGGDNVTGGGIRVFYSFTIGILVYRSNWIIRSGLGFLTTSVLLTLVFIIPYSEQYNRFMDPIIVICCFPLLVAFGAGARLNPVFNKICNFSGEISYPLYMVHYPFIWLFMSYVEAKTPTIGQMTIIITIGVLLLISLAYLVLILVDIPIRSYLKRNVKKALTTEK
jgi:peptidoglycan/LPS O-acetylase OafA/YrhL